MIELMVVVGIIGILMAVLLGTFSGSTESARAAKCQANMHNLAMAAQSYAMANGYYPAAGTVTYRENGQETTSQGWIGDDTDDPYEENEDTREDCLKNGELWSYVKGGRDCYVCPTHRKYAQEHNKKKEPLWSYAMNSRFGFGTKRRKDYETFSRRDRTLLFAELPFASMKVGTETIQEAATSGVALDHVLDYSAGEIIGFNHKDGRNVVGHVCFADGHTEKLRAPKKDNIADLSKWLCYPQEDNDDGTKKTDFDVIFDGSVYKKSTEEN